MNERPIDAQAIAAIVRRFDARPELLVQILVAVSREHGWISPEVVRQVAATLNLSRAEVHGVVEYYHDFRTRPPGRHVVRVCNAEACQAAGGRVLVAHAQDAADEDTTIEPVFCLGNCACAPAVMVDGKTYGRVDRERFDDLLATARGDRS